VVARDHGAIGVRGKVECGVGEGVGKETPSGLVESHLSKTAKGGAPSAEKIAAQSLRLDEGGPPGNEDLQPANTRRRFRMRLHLVRWCSPQISGALTTSPHFSDSVRAVAP